VPTKKVFKLLKVHPRSPLPVAENGIRHCYKLTQTILLLPFGDLLVDAQGTILPRHREYDSKNKGDKWMIREIPENVHPHAFHPPSSENF